MKTSETRITMRHSNNFNELYKDMLSDLLHYSNNIITNRKGSKLHEITLASFCLTDPDNAYAYSRNMDFRYMIGEFLFYLKGENKLENIVKYSKFWKKVSDDGVTLNSCYGYYIWNMTPLINTQSGFQTGYKNQFDYCCGQLYNNEHSKKAVITIYEGSKHSYKTNDNPCTMYMQFLIRDNALHMIVNMRSNDIWFGLTYDVPFFCFVMKMMYYKIKVKYPDLKLGSYTHISNSLHLYEKDFEKSEEVLKNYTIKAHAVVPVLDKRFFDEGISHFKDIETCTTLDIYELCSHEFNSWAYNVLNRQSIPSLIKIKDYDNKYFDNALTASKKSTCLKKKVGCVIVRNRIISSIGWGGRSDHQGWCKECVAKKEKFYHDSCNSIHSEYRAVFNYLKSVNHSKQWLMGADMYITHGPCDQCIKLLVDIQMGRVFYKEPYKTDFTRYKGLIEVYECKDENSIRRII